MIKTHATGKRQQIAFKEAILGWNYKTKLLLPFHSVLQCLTRRNERLSSFVCFTPLKFLVWLFIFPDDLKYFKPFGFRWKVKGLENVNLKLFPSTVLSFYHSIHSSWVISDPVESFKSRLGSLFWIHCLVKNKHPAQLRKVDADHKRDKF